MAKLTDAEKKLSAIKKANEMAGKDVESSGEDSDGSEGAGGLFINPLAAKQKDNKKEESEEWSDDDESQDGKGKSKKDKKKDKTILGKRKRKGSIDAV